LKESFNEKILKDQLSKNLTIIPKKGKIEKNGQTVKTQILTEK
jgi:hypothetical protein